MIVLAVIVLAVIVLAVIIAVMAMVAAMMTIVVVVLRAGRAHKGYGEEQRYERHQNFPHARCDGHGLLRVVMPEAIATALAVISSLTCRKANARVCSHAQVRVKFKCGASYGDRSSSPART